MSIDEHYGFISRVGFQHKLIVHFLILKEWKTKRCCEVSRFILNNFRTKSQKYDTNQFLPLNSWSWVYVRCLDHSRFLVNQTKNSRSKTTTIPRFATLRQSRLDYAIEARLGNRGSITQSTHRFFYRGSFSQPRLAFKKERKKEKKEGRKEGRREGRKKERKNGGKKERKRRRILQN